MEIYLIYERFFLRESWDFNRNRDYLFYPIFFKLKFKDQSDKRKIGIVYWCRFTEIRFLK